MFWCMLSTWRSTALFRQIYLESMNVLWVTDTEIYECEFSRFFCTVLLVTGHSWEVTNHISILDFCPCVTKVAFQVGYNLVSPCSCLSNPFLFFFHAIELQTSQQDIFNFCVSCFSGTCLHTGEEVDFFFCMIVGLCIWICSCIVQYNTLKSKILKSHSF